MPTPSTFTTQSLGELILQADNSSYRPTNQNAHRFLFQPGNTHPLKAWTALIDQRVPLLNSQWPALLASSVDKLRESLSAIGRSELGNDAQLRHITLDELGKAVLIVSLDDSEESHSLEAHINEDNQITNIFATR